MSSNKDRCGLETLLEYVASDRRNDLLRHVRDLCDRECYNYDHTFLGFISDYIHYADLILRQVETHEHLQTFFPGKGKKVPFHITVFDVGCAAALQHLVFDPRIHYVGIDIQERAPAFFRPNCTYIRGTFGDIVDQLKVGPDDFGIANMSLLYGSREDLPAFDRVFTRKFVL